MRHLLATAFLISTASTAFAADDFAVCDAALIKDAFATNATLTSDYRAASLVTSDNFSEAKKNADASGELFGIKVGANYGEYNQNRQKTYSEHSASLNVNDSRNLAWSKLSSNSLAAYTVCINAKIRLAHGLHISYESSTQSEITVIISWTPVGYDPLDIPIRWNRRSTNTLQLPTSIHAGNFALTVPRPTSEMTLTGNSKAGPITIVLEPLLPDPVASAPKLITCEWQKLLHFTNDLRLSTLPGSPEEKAVMEGQRGNYYAAGNAGRIWPFEAAQFGLPVDAVIEPGIAISASDPAKFRLFDISATKTDDRHISVRAHSEFGGVASTPVWLQFRYTFNPHGGVCPPKPSI